MEPAIVHRDPLSLCISENVILAEHFAHYISFHDLLRLRAVCKTFCEKTKIVTQRVVRRFWEWRITHDGLRDGHWYRKHEAPVDEFAHPDTKYYVMVESYMAQLDVEDIELDQSAPILSYMALRKQFLLTYRTPSYMQKIEEVKEFDFPLEPVGKKLKK